MTTASKPAVLAITRNSDAHLAWMREHFDITVAVEPDFRQRTIEQHGARFRCVLTNGSEGLHADEITALPNLTLVCVQGTGYEKVDVAAARQRGITVTNGASSNAITVSDHAFALMFSLVRGIPMLDAFARQGGWRSQLQPLPIVSGRRLGLCGMGAIGQCIARRAAAFDMPVGYFSRNPKPDVPATHFSSVMALAAWAEVLIVALPGGMATHHLIGGDALRALGSKGYVINVGRGSVVDTVALVACLHASEIAGAGLDVYEGEPAFPAAFENCPNLLVTPHVGGWSQEALDNSVRMFIDNALRHFSGRPLTGVL
ncbi:2-hydroxyacid dehydrogenase [Orrella dioscoreae]|uniref:D-3-phosphoglycerate dehydrogenase n=1 Tax=Orrella dioscoreae TaxID=1851544 RepID=A0A1C3K4M8_9BURK|nr:2-hydroxyacid dehydrogenase [Orrella dioscoreae]SBT26355.1 D-3-phosphoglycerate dehydrogenase [Orrella dioscoreae]SOE46503.1 D-3-phosphoglycerate dehydrogenase [Orrella dioscoreae]